MSRDLSRSFNGTISCPFARLCWLLPLDGERDIRLYGTTVQGMSGQKLAIWNRGGMNLKTLMQFSNINAAIDKTNAVDENFGRGAAAR